MKASDERLDCACSANCVVCRASWSCLRVLSLLRVIFTQNLSCFFERRDISFARLAVFHVVFFLFLACMSINPTKAFADTYIGGPYVNKNDAGLSYLGYDYDELVDESKHTALSELVQYGESKYPDYFTWTNTFYTQFNDVRYYWSNVDGMQFVDLTDRARRDVQKAAKAADDYNTSIGGGGQVEGDYYVFTGNVVYYQWYIQSSYINGDDGYKYSTSVEAPDRNNIYRLLPEILKVRIPKSSLASLNSYYPYESNTWYLFLGISSGDIYFYVVSGSDVTMVSKTQNISTENFSVSNDYIYTLNGTTARNCTFPYRSQFTYSNGVLTYTGTNAPSAQVMNGSFWNSTYESFYLSSNGDDTTEPEPEPEPEPVVPTTPPETPTPPELPEPELPTEPVVPESPDLSDLLAALDEHCRHLQQAIYNGLSDYYDSITDYFEDVNKWLADTFKYYDNELDKRFQSVFSYQRTANRYLQRIDDKLQEIIDKLDGLGESVGLEDIPDSYNASENNATQGSSVLVNAYQSLRSKFPFSVLDKITAVATSLKHEAVAPKLDLPVGNPFGQQPYIVSLDFTDWSSLAAVIRTGELVFAYLALSKSAIRIWQGEGES